MGWLGKIFGIGGDAVAKPVEAVGGVLDKLFTSDDEKLEKRIILERLSQQPHLAQVELNKLEAQHRTLFVAGWRPAIGWICAIGLAFPFVLNPVLQWATGDVGPSLPLDTMMELVIAMLGLGGLRTFEKITGKAK